ncbi:MAG: alternate F1F0 ATPase, F1 subunit alpha [Desulfarculaceae bacterium]|nr:alternate F1F0 ATPase, F1 subunit alpha [Desulfarculaceae bacterium]MCF8073161.1 alternate F1F0 ATPase, F1 subunit alpha [Desulfarculaceae bacterium]MCF8100757.1 alternate F1F0 ATPase, F1 subunit alpha [Desulfarculaceae bacterium]MCF8118404.1 alternate F1F0 ATPase, F1 subunit alpha [Desulfarculaceae bacterium]
MPERPAELRRALEALEGALDQAADAPGPRPRLQEVGAVLSVGPGVVRVGGLRGVKSEEILLFEGGVEGMAFNLDRREVGVILLDEGEGLSAGGEVRRSGRVLDTPVGKGLLGRVVDARARPLDNLGPIETTETLPVERPAPEIMQRAPVTVPLQTGIKVVDAMIPIGRGQRELILGDRQTGKTALAVDTILNQGDKGVVCIYCAVGKRSSAVARVVESLREAGALEYSLVMVATEEDPPGLQFFAPYAATTMGEWFMAQGRDVLVVYDDLTRHSRAYRELSLLLRRPPGREAFPGDIFYVHSRLLERSTHLREEHGGGSLTALPIIETEAQNLSAYIPTNLISITDGQVYLNPDLFRKGILPAVDVGRSVSRVGGKTQLPAYHRVAGDLRLSYTQFEELESFARFGSRLDEDTRQNLERGRRVREVLKQPQYQPMPVAEQIAVLVAVNQGLFDRLELGRVAEAEQEVRRVMRGPLAKLAEDIAQGKQLSEEDVKEIQEVARQTLNLEPGGDPDEAGGQAPAEGEG